MSDSTIDPLKEAQADAQKWMTLLWNRAADWFRKYATAALVKVVLPGVLSIGLLIAVFPWFVVGAAVVVTGGLIVYAVYATRQLKRMDAERRWTWVGQQRQQQRVLQLEDAVDHATLALLEDRHELARVRPQELRAAVAHLRSKYIAELAAKQNPAAPPRPVTSAPDLTTVKRRLQVRAAKLKEAEARIQSYADPHNIENQMAAEEAIRTRREIEDDALAADRAARENERRGRTASPSSPGISIGMKIGATGVQSVTTNSPPPTPEQIARGEVRKVSEGPPNQPSNAAISATDPSRCSGCETGRTRGS